MKKGLVLAIVAGILLTGATQVQSVTVDNYSFELPGTVKQYNWENVPNWSSDTVATASGVEDNGYVGVWNGYLMAGGDPADPSVWQLTGHTIAAGEVFTLAIAVRIGWMEGTTGDLGKQATYKMTLYYDNGGTRTVAKTRDVVMTTTIDTGSGALRSEWAEYTLDFDVDADCPAAIGNNIGIELFGVSHEGPAGCWLAMDSVRLTVGEVGSGNNYYVDSTNGSDSWNGNYPSHEDGVNGPWKTIAKVNDYAENPRFSDGTVICFKRGEVWRNDETIGYDTSTISWGTLNGLTIQDYGTGAKPWIDGSSQAAIYIYGYNTLSNLVIRNIDVSGLGWVGPPETANIYVAHVTNITIDDIYADGHKGTPTEFIVKGPIKIGANLGDLVIKNCEIFNIMQRNTLYRGPVNQYTITINNYHVAAKAKLTGSVKIINNTVHDVVGDILQPANVRPPGGFLIADNVFYHFGENAIDLKSCSNVIIENNEIYRDFGGSDKYCEDYWPDKIFNFGMIVTHAVTDGPTCENITIRNNYIHSAGNFRTFEIGGANNLQIYNNYFKDVGRIELSTNRCTVHNNIWDVTHDPVCDDFIYCSLGTTSCSASTLSLIAPSSGMRFCKIFNNTFYIKSNTINYGMYYRKFLTSVNNEIFNNIFYFDRDDTNSYPLYFYIRDGSSDIPDVHNNLYFNPSRTNRIYWNGTIYDSTEQTVWQDAGHPGDIFADPIFVDPENSGFHLQSSSPMIDTGTFLTTITSNTASSQTSFTVVDAGCFYDGWDIPGEVGNAVKTQNGQTTIIQTVDYDTNTITVNPAINIVNNEGVALNYEGSAPDVGASEFTGIACLPIDQTGWELLYVDSEELGEESGAAINSFDGDPCTIWHTEWPENLPHPHEIQIDLGGVYAICGFRQLPRQSGGTNGTIKDYEFYVSNNPDDWGTAVASGTFASDQTEKTVSFDRVLGRYVRLRALSEINDGPWTSVAELNVLAVQPDTDINNDGKVNIEDFAVLATGWDDEDACSSPDWCGGADFNMSGTVDMLDLTYFAENWLRQAD